MSNFIYAAHKMSTYYTGNTLFMQSTIGIFVLFFGYFVNKKFDTYAIWY